MERKAFGALIRSLRLEHQDVVKGQIRRWSRQRLSEETEREGPVILSDVAIGKIERGERHHLLPAELVALARALHLTAAERRHFLRAASGVSIRDEMANDPFAAPQRLDELRGLMEPLRVPWLIHDQYGDVICASSIELALLRVEESRFALYRDRPAVFNIMRALFDPEIGLRRMLGGDETQWRRIQIENVLYFRALVLDYRGEMYTRAVMAELRALPEFSAIWEQAYKWERDFFGLPTVYHYDHPDWGTLHYIAHRTVVETPAGPLVAVVYLPQDVGTADVFVKLHRTVAKRTCRRLAPWPAKPGTARLIIDS